MKYIFFPHLYRSRYVRTYWIMCGGSSPSQYTKDQSVLSIGCVRIVDFVTSRRIMEDTFKQRWAIECCTKFVKRAAETYKLFLTSLREVCPIVRTTYRVEEKV